MNPNETLLTVNNPKIEKGTARGFLTHILHLAPASISGYNVCPGATVGCSFACLFTAGMGGIIKKGETTNAIQIARIRKTLAYFEHRDAFMAKLVKEIGNGIKRAAKLNLIPVFRLNGTSDVRWETVPVVRDDVTYDNIMLAFPTIQFYDYTKLANRRNLPKNYHLTFSLAESNMDQAVTAYRNGMNIAAVFRTMPVAFTLESGLHMYHVPVINGDETDLRFLDRKGVIVGLKAKGKAKKDTSGFVQN